MVNLSEIKDLFCKTKKSCYIYAFWTVGRNWNTWRKLMKTQRENLDIGLN